MDKNAGENGKIAVYLVSACPESTDCFNISVPELYPDEHRNEARKGVPLSCPEGESNIVEGCFYLIKVEYTTI